MSRERADLGFAESLDTFDPKDWQPKTKSHDNDIFKTTTLSAAAASGFSSREPRSKSETMPLRRRRTGRNAQFNLKARPETIAIFTRIADSQGWGLAETLEHAVALLEREYGDEKKDQR